MAINFKVLAASLLLSGLVSGCITRLPSSDLSNLQGQTVAFEIAPNYVAESVAISRQPFVNIGYSSAAAGAQLVKDFNLPHPGQILAYELQQTLSQRLNMRFAPVARYRILINDVKWEISPPSLIRGAYLDYTANVEMIDVLTNKKIVDMPMNLPLCIKKVIPNKNQKSSLEDLFANNGALISQGLRYGAQDCVETFLTIGLRIYN